MTRENKKNLWVLVGGFVLMVFASLFFGDAMESLQKYLGARASEHADSSKNALGVLGFLLTLAGGITAYVGIAGLCSSNKGTPLKPNHGLRVFLATLACGAVFFLNCGIGALITGGKGHGGLMGILVLLSVLGWVWRAIVGDSSAPAIVKDKPKTRQPESSPSWTPQKTESSQVPAQAPIHNYANEYIGKRFEVKSDDGRFILDEPVAEPVRPLPQEHQEAVPTPPKPEEPSAPPSTPHNDLSNAGDQSSTLTHRSDGTGDSNLGCVIAGGLVVVVLIGVVVAISSSSDEQTATASSSREVSAPNISDEFSEEVESVENLPEIKKKEEKRIPLEERATKCIVYDKNRDFPVEMLDESGWSSAQSNAVKRFDAFWGVPFGMKVDPTDKKDWFYEIDGYKNRYAFRPASGTGDIEFYNFSATPKTHRVWRIACGAECQTLREALEEVKRLRDRVSIYKTNEEFFSSDGAWVVYSGNTNRTIEIRVEKWRNNSYFAEAVAFDMSIGRQVEQEGVTSDEELSGIFGVSLGDVAEGGTFTVDPNDPSLYDFKPSKRFRNFQIYDVHVTPRSHTICKIRTMRKFETQAEADEEAQAVLEVFRMKYRGVAHGESDNMKKGWREWYFTFRPIMEHNRRLLVATSPDNYLIITAVADSDYFDLFNREKVQNEVDKLNADINSL